ncbi:MAG TPA: hypothetical protein VMC10_17085 [Stellaceae bacterium]|nr:hypothetical protein [Stellaceae bacterium]
MSGQNLQGMRSFRLLIAIVSVSLLSGCTSSPIPEGYKGPTARIEDSFKKRGWSSADFFYVSKIDGRRINDSLAATTQSNYGQGFQLTPIAIGRAVAAQESTFTIVGRTHYAAPILELAGTVYQVSGDVKFSPQPDQIYYVRGELDEKYSGVWIEDAAGTPVTPKIEVNGSSALSIFEK